MRTLRLSLVGAAMLALLSGLGGTALAQDEPSGATASEVVWELLIPSEALPHDFVKLVVEDWTLAPGADTTDSAASVLKNEALRGRGLVVENGQLLITPATDAMLWRVAEGDPQASAAGETVTLAVGDAIFLPAGPVDEADSETPIGIANPGTEAVTARSFHTHQSRGSFYGYPQGLTLGDWDMADSFEPAAKEALNGVDVLFRLSRITGEPGAPMPTTDPVAMYFVEAGALELTSSGPGGESVFEWPTGKNGLMVRLEGLENTLRVAGDADATALEFAAIPQPTPVE